MASFLLAGEALFLPLIIRRVPYTEIDWEAYMSEVRGFAEGERDYAKLEGATGPLVYPAGFVYLFDVLRRITSDGSDIALAQSVFAGLLWVTQLLACAVYISSRSLPPAALATLFVSRRLRSIFVLRLFNDGWVAALQLLGILLLQHGCFVSCIVVFSAAVSIKMSALLLAPGVLAVVVKRATLRDLWIGAGLGVLLQLVLAAPFLLAHPASYFMRAFELSRTFKQVWSVNWQFLPEPLFISPRFAILLLGMHFRIISSFTSNRWFEDVGGSVAVMEQFKARTRDQSRALVRAVSAADDALYLVATSTLAGVLAARSLHYQFYAWYFYFLPFALLRTTLPTLFALATLAAIEALWNVFPPTALTSAGLFAAHALTLVATWALRAPFPQQVISKVAHRAKKVGGKRV